MQGCKCLLRPCHCIPMSATSSSWTHAHALHPGDGARRRRLVLQKLEVAISVDAVVGAVRAYLERSCRELLAKGPGGQPSQAEQGEDTLQEQLAILNSWHGWLLGHLRHFKARRACCSPCSPSAAACRLPLIWPRDALLGLGS